MDMLDAVDATDPTNAAVSVAATSSNVIERAKSSAIRTFAVSRAHATTTNRRSTLLTKHC